MSAAPVFIDYAREVMATREEEGVRGVEREASRFRCHLEGSPLAALPIDQIRREWLRWMAQKEAADHRSERKISHETICRSKALVSAVFAHAVDREILEANPCVGVKLKRRADESATREKWSFLTIDEQRALAACEAIASFDRLAMRFAIATGLRQGEQFNLELADIRVDDEVPHVVVRYASRKKGKKLPPKSGKIRTVPLFEDGLLVVRELLVYLADKPNEEALAFPSVRGKRRQPGKPLGDSKAVRAAYVAAGITLRPHLHWHALRHTFATNLVSGALGRRWTLEEIRPLLGHSSIAITQRYAHLSEDAIKRAVRETIAAAAATAAAASVVIPPAPPSNTNDTRSILAEGAQRVRDYVTKHLPDVVVKRARLLFSRRVA